MNITKIFIFLVISFQFYVNLAYSQTGCTNTNRKCLFEFQGQHQDYFFTHYLIGSSSDTTLETDNLSSGGDTVITAYGSDGSVCQNDDMYDSSGLPSGQIRSKIKFVSSPSVNGECEQNVGVLYRIVVRSYNASSGGTFTLKKDGGIVSSSLSFGGRFWNTKWNQNEQFQAVNSSLKGDPGIDTIMVIGSKPPPAIQDMKFDDDGGLFYSPLIYTTTTSASSSDGYVIIGRYSSSSITLNSDVHKVVVYRNDKSTSSAYQYVSPTLCWDSQDHDCDGLGNKLESDIGTCSCIVGKDNQFTCSVSTPGACIPNINTSTFDARDTDGDGIPDSWEVFGRVWTDPQTSINYTTELPRYGADPLHKDLFIETHLRTGGPEVTPYGSCGNLSSPPYNFVCNYFISDFIKFFAAGPGDANNLNNPDNENGIRIHIDVKFGAAPYNPGVIGNLSLFENGKYIGSYGDWGGYKTLSPTGPEEDISLGRRGIWKLNISNSTPFAKIGRDVIRGSTYSNQIHESGHSFGLDHGGDPKNADNINCKPNYPSRMNYAYNQVKYHNGSFPDINPSQLNEGAGMIVPGSVVVSDYKSFLENIFYGFVVDVNGGINWNRNTSPSENNIRAYIGPRFDVNCPEEGAVSFFGFRAIRSDDNSSGFYVNPQDLETNSGTDIKYSATKHELYVSAISKDSQGNRILVVKKGIGTSWSNVTIPSSVLQQTPIEGESVTSVIHQGNLYIAFRRSIGGAAPKMYYTKMDSSYTFSNVQQISSEVVDSALSFFSDGTNLEIYYLQDNSGQKVLYKQSYNSSTNLWQTKQVQKDTNNADLKGNHVGTVVQADGIKYMFLPQSGQNIYKIFVYKYITGTGKWELIGNDDDNSSSTPLNLFSKAINSYNSSKYPKTDVRIAAIYDNRSTHPNGFHLWYKPQGSQTYFRFFSTKHDSSKNPPFEFIFQNRITAGGHSGTAGLALAASSSGGSLDRLYGVSKRRVSSLDILLLHPYADGIPNEPITATNDWKTIGKYMCYGIAASPHDPNEPLLGADPAICQDNPNQ